MCMWQLCFGIWVVHNQVTHSSTDASTVMHTTSVRCCFLSAFRPCTSSRAVPHGVVCASTHVEQLLLDLYACRHGSTSHAKRQRSVPGSRQRERSKCIEHLIDVAHSTTETSVVCGMESQLHKCCILDLIMDARAYGRVVQSIIRQGSKKHDKAG